MGKQLILDRRDEKRNLVNTEINNLTEAGKR